ncbi:uncharacterized protein LOC132619459 [Lycium barbarum]|uniref:uncharacterized protein LOC132619459 n=1 Tax=Lycium barbarum TaxID=112863 RepID=UPI00293E14F8|nr:uncharacterized protein LOC132619459 [Lycium barbarum]
MALCNDLWVMKYGGVTAQFLENHFSDHSLIHFEITSGGVQNKKPFRFINALADDNKFLQRVDSVWQQHVKGTSMYRLWCKLKFCKVPIKQLKQRVLGTTDKRINDTRDSLTAIQSLITAQFDQELVMKEKEATEKLNKWLGCKTGDIEKEILKFYKGLLGSAAESIDGFNAHFFKKAFRIIQGDVHEAIKEFFHENRLLRAVSNTMMIYSCLQGGDESSVMLLREKLTIFSEASWLKANIAKSQVYFGGVDQQTRDNILGILGYEVGDLPFRYLGVLLSTKRLTVQQCKPLVEKITSKITNWMAKCLLYAGRLQLIRAVLFGVQTYWSQLFLLSKKGIKMILAICRSYLWSGEASITKKALVAWDKICLPKGVGCMNLVNLRIWNQTAICKLLWALSQHKEKLWITWVHIYYIKKQDILTMEMPKQASWMIRKIINMRKH